MGYDITVTNRSASAAVKRGVAEIHSFPGELRTVYDGDGNPMDEMRDTDRRVLSFNGESLAMSDWGHRDWGFWTHCSYGGDLGPKLMAILNRLHIAYRMGE